MVGQPGVIPDELRRYHLWNKSKRRRRIMARNRTNIPRSYEMPVSPPMVPQESRRFTDAYYTIGRKRWAQTVDLLLNSNQRNGPSLRARYSSELRCSWRLDSPQWLICHGATSPGRYSRMELILKARPFAAFENTPSRIWRLQVHRFRRKTTKQ